MANNYYVSTSGNDLTGDGSYGNPYAHPPGGMCAAATDNSANVSLVSGDNVYLKRGDTWTVEKLILFHNLNGITLSTYSSAINGSDDDTQPLPIWNAHKDLTGITFEFDTTPAFNGDPIYSVTYSGVPEAIVLGNIDENGHFNNVTGTIDTATRGAQFVDAGDVTALDPISVTKEPHIILILAYGDKFNAVGILRERTVGTQSAPAAGEWGWDATAGGSLYLGDSITGASNILYRVNIDQENPWMACRDSAGDHKLYIYSVENPFVRYDYTMLSCEQLPAVSPEIISELNTAVRHGWYCFYMGNCNDCVIENIEFRGAINTVFVMEPLSALGGTLNNNIVQDCKIGYLGQAIMFSLLSVDASTYRANYNIIRRNILDSNMTPDGAICSSQVQTDLVWPTSYAPYAGDGIRILGAVANNIIEDNEVIDTGHSAFVLDSSGTSLPPRHNVLKGNKTTKVNSPYVRPLGTAHCHDNLITGNDFRVCEIKNQLSGTDNIVEGNLFSAQLTITRGGITNVSNAIKFIAKDGQPCTGFIVRNNTFFDVEEEVLYFNSSLEETIGVNYFYNNIVYNGARNLSSYTIRYEPTDGIMEKQVFKGNIIYTSDGDHSEATDGLIIRYWDGTQYLHRTVAEMEADVANTGWESNAQVDPLLDNNLMPQYANAYHGGVATNFTARDFRGHKFNVPPTVGAYEFTRGSKAPVRSIAPTRELKTDIGLRYVNGLGYYREGSIYSGLKAVAATRLTEKLATGVNTVKVKEGNLDVTIGFGLTEELADADRKIVLAGVDTLISVIPDGYVSWKATDDISTGEIYLEQSVSR